MSTWLGIAILTLFSLGLTLFMRLGVRSTPRNLPEGLGQWREVPNPGGAEHDDATVLERRLLLDDGGFFSRGRLIEQRRRRRRSDGEIVEVLGERAVDG